MNAFPLSIVQGLLGSLGSIGRTPLAAVSSSRPRAGRSASSIGGFLPILQQGLARAVDRQDAAPGATASTGSSWIDTLMAQLRSGGNSDLSTRLEKCPFLKNTEWVAALREGLPGLLKRLSASQKDGSEEGSLADLVQLLRDRTGATSDSGSLNPDDDLSGITGGVGGIAGIFSGIAEILGGIVQVLSSGDGDGNASARDGGPLRRTDLPAALLTRGDGSLLLSPSGATDARSTEIAAFLRRLDYVLHLLQRGSLSKSGLRFRTLTLPDTEETPAPVQPSDATRVLPTGGGRLFASASNDSDSARTQALGDILSVRPAATRGDAVPATGTIWAPDRIYYVSKTASETASKIASSSLPGDMAESLDAGRIRLVSLPGSTGENPVAALQSLIENVREWKERQGPQAQGERLTAADGRSAWARLAGVEMQTLLHDAPYRANGAPETARVETSALIESVRQTQAAISDMVDRMKGDVSLNSRNLSAVIHLDPPSLGRLHIRLAIEDGQGVQAQFDSDQSGTMNFLRQNQDDLRQELARQGFAESRVRLSFGGDDGFTDTFVRSAAIA